MKHSKLCFVHISDTHILEDDRRTTEFSKMPPNQNARLLVKHINQLPFHVDFVLHTGDVVEESNTACYRKACEIFSLLKAHIYYLVGNHDDAQRLQANLLGQTLFDKCLHHYYDLSIQGHRLIALNSHNPALSPAGSLTNDQLNWLEQTCQKDELPLIIAIHHHPFRVGLRWLDEHMLLVNNISLHDVIKEFAARIRGVFHGHIHQSTELIQDGVLYSGVASSSFQFLADESVQKTRVDGDGVPEFSVVRINGPQTFIRRYPF